MSAKWFSKVLPLIILLAGAGIFALLKATGSTPQQVEEPYLGPLVETAPFPLRDFALSVAGQGAVRPSAQIDLVPQVSGVVVWKSAKLEGGGYFSRGEELLRIEAEDYELALAQAEALAAQANLRLEQAREQAAVARQEWELLHPGQQGSPLALYVPQLEAAEADLRAAQARVEEARLRLKRTRLQAPFAGRVRSSRAEVGQYLNLGQAVAQLYSTEQAEIAVPVPDEELAFLDLGLPAESGAPVWGAPGERGRDSAGQGAQATIKTWYAGRLCQWQGRVVRTEGELDAQSRMVNLVVEVDDPYGQGETPLMVGMFVEVEIAGRRAEGVRVLPRAALHQDNKVWITGPEGLLRVKPVQVVRATQDQVAIYMDLAPAEQVILTPLSGVSDGMKVRLAGEVGR